MCREVTASAPPCVPPWSCRGALQSPGAAASPLAPPAAASASNPPDCQEQDFSIPMRSDRSVSPHLGFALSCSGPVGSQLGSLHPLSCKGRLLSSREHS